MGEESTGCGRGVASPVVRGGRSVGDFDDDGGGVVATAFGDGHLDDAGGGGEVGEAGRGIEECFGDAAVPEPVGDPIGAEEEAVAGVAADGTDLGFGELVASAEGFAEDVLARVGAGLAFVDFAGVAEPADVGVVGGDLAELAGGGEVVETAVADVGVVEPAWDEPAECQGCAHAVAFLVDAAETGHFVMDGGDEGFEDIGEAGGEAEGAVLEAAWEEPRDFVDGDAAGEFAAVGAAHAVADGEDEVGVGGGAGAVFAEEADPF